MFYFLLVSPIFLMMFSVGFVQFKMYSLHAIDFILFPELPVVVLSNWMIMSELLLTNVIYHWTCRVHGLAARPLLMNFFVYIHSIRTSSNSQVGKLTMSEKTILQTDTGEICNNVVSQPFACVAVLYGKQWIVTLTSHAFHKG